MPILLRGLRHGVVTSRWPRRRDDYFDDFPAAVEVIGSKTDAARGRLRARLATDPDLSPTGAVAVAEDGSVTLDRGRSLVTGRLVAEFPEVFAVAHGAAIARLRREALVVGDIDETDTSLAKVQAALAHRVRRLRRSVHIRYVDAGSDGSDDWEVQALANPVYDIHRLGIFFTASPRHADILLVTGIGAAGMLRPLARTREAMPDPVVVIAAGVDAISGGLVDGGIVGDRSAPGRPGDGIGERPVARSGVGSVLDVDVWVPGSPASPFSLLHAILLALGRVS